MAFNIDMSPLERSSMNVMGGLNQIGQTFAANQQQAQQQQQQQEQQAQMEAMLQSASQGDPAAMGQLWGSNPEMAMMFEERAADKVATLGAAKAMESKKAEVDWGLKWKSATPDQKATLLTEALANPLIDFDEEDVGIEGVQADLAVNSMLYGHLGKDAYKDLGIGGIDEGLSDQPSKVRETIWYNNQTPEVQKTHMKLLRAEKPSLNEKLEYEKAKSEIKEDSAISTARKKTSNERRQGYIDSGVSSADNLQAVNRSIELLESVKTGGIDNAMIRAKQMFGIESADEAELSYELGKSVLKQLKPTFGAAFTVNEMLELKRMEAGLGKSIPGNRRILANLSKMIKRSAERGLRAADSIGEEFAANEIRLALYGGTPQETQPAQAQQSAGNADVPEQTQFTEGMTATGPNGEVATFINGQWVIK